MERTIQAIDTVMKMVFSTFIIWIICLFASTSAQEVTSTLPASNRTCPGTRITFNCSITGSDLVTNLIIAWGSPEYIGQAAFLQFTTANMIGDNATSMINSDVIAQLVYKGDRNGIPTLESQLQLTVFSNFMNPTVTCLSFPSGAMRSITFYTLSIPGIPHNAKGTEVPTDGRCVLLLAWDTPLDYDEKDIDSYFVKGPFDVIKTKEKSTLVSFNIPRCISDLSVNISAVDRCNQEGPSTVIVVQLGSSETLPTQQVTTPQENQSGPDEDAVIVAVIGSILTVTVMFVIVMGILMFCYFRKRFKEHEILRQDRREIELADKQTNLGNKDDPKFVDGQTALNLASKSRHTNVVKLDVGCGAQLDNKRQIVKSGQITDPDRLFNDLSDHIGDKYLKIGLELKLTYTDLVSELDAGIFQMKPASEKAMKMLHLWKCCSDEERFTYAVLAAALEKWGLKICAEQYCYTSTEVVKSGQITDPDRLFRDLSLVIGENYKDIGIDLGLKGEVLTNELETGQFKILQGSKKALRMLQLWRDSVDEDHFTYSVLAAALEKHGFQSCAHMYCYTSSHS